MYYGDIRLGSTIDFKFNTINSSTGAPITLAGSPSLAAYVDNGTGEITAGLTLSVDFDGVTGLNNVRVVATSGNGFTTATNVVIVIAAGTANSISVVGSVVGSFSIENRSAVNPTVAGRTLDITATGGAGIDWSNVENPTTTLNLSGTSTLALEPTTAGRKLDVTAGGEAGIDWANIGSPTNVNNLSGTTIKTATDIATQIAALNNLSIAQVQAIMDGTIADTIPADGTRPSIASGILMLTRFLMEASITGTTVTVNKENGSTASMTFTINDASAPTAITRAT